MSKTNGSPKTKGSNMKKIVENFNAITTAFLLMAAVPSIEAISAPSPSPSSSNRGVVAPIAKDAARSDAQTDVKDEHQNRETTDNTRKDINERVDPSEG